MAITSNVSVQPPDSNAIPPVIPPNTLKIKGKTYRITSLRIRDHAQQEWRNVDINNCQHLDMIARQCDRLFTELTPTNEANLKKVSFTFEFGNSGFLGKDKMSTLQLKKIDYVDPNSKTQTFEVQLEAYTTAEQQTLKQIIDPLLPTARLVYVISQPKQKQLHSSTQPSQTSSHQTPDDSTHTEEYQTIDINSAMGTDNSNDSDNDLSSSTY